MTMRNLKARSMPGTRQSYEVSFKLRAVAVAESKSKEAAASNARTGTRVFSK